MHPDGVIRMVTRDGMCSDKVVNYAYGHFYIDYLIDDRVEIYDGDLQSGLGNRYINTAQSNPIIGFKMQVRVK